MEVLIDAWRTDCFEFGVFVIEVKEDDALAFAAIADLAAADGILEVVGEADVEALFSFDSRTVRVSWSANELVSSVVEFPIARGYSHAANK